MEPAKSKTEVQRIGGHLKEIVTFFDNSGKPIGHVMNPMMVELKPRDVAQIFVGALLVSSPLCFTEEVWVLSKELPMQNVYWLMIASTIAVTAYVYFNFYRFKLKGNVIEFTKRIIAIYVITTLSVVLMLFLIDKLPVKTDFMVALKRVVIIGFPSVFAATITDSIK